MDPESGRWEQPGSWRGLPALTRKMLHWEGWATTPLSPSMTIRKRLVLVIIAGLFASAFVVSFPLRTSSRSVDSHRLYFQDFRSLQKQTVNFPGLLRKRIRLNLPRESWRFDFSQALRVRPELWILRKDDLVCLVQGPGGALVCSPPAIFARKGIFLGTFRTVGPKEALADFSVVGLVPDEIRSAELAYGDNRIRVRADHNLIRFHANAPIFVRRMFKRHLSIRHTRHALSFTRRSKPLKAPAGSRCRACRRWR
jgi:hypothetical protein